MAAAAAAVFCVLTSFASIMLRHHVVVCSFSSFSAFDPMISFSRLNK